MTGKSNRFIRKIKKRIWDAPQQKFIAMKVLYVYDEMPKSYQTYMGECTLTGLKSDRRHRICLQAQP